MDAVSGAASRVGPGGSSAGWSAGWWRSSVFVLLVVLAVLLAVSVVLVVVADRLLRSLRRPGGPGAGRTRSAPSRPPGSGPDRARSEARPTRRRSDQPGGLRPLDQGREVDSAPTRPAGGEPGQTGAAAPPTSASRPAEPPAPPRGDAPPSRPSEPAPSGESRSRRVPPAPERPDEGAARRGRGRRGGAVERLHLARMEPSTRQRYAQTFQRTSARFAEEPVTALSDADKLVALLLDERGLPVPSAGADLGVDSAQASLLGDYLAAHAIAEASRSQEMSREELEAGMARYQRLVLTLLDDGEGAGAGAPRS